ncbi:SMI1/KNR4 family protein [Kitasatospora sp. NPDC004289]
MHQPIDHLTDLLGPPTHHPAPVPWELAPAAHPDLRFPSDYRRLIDTYGSIRIREDLGIHGPSRKNYYGEGFAAVIAATADVGDQVEYVHEEPKFPDETSPTPPYPMFPAPGGLLSWGGDTFGNYFFWLTNDQDPDTWPVVVWFQEIEVWDVFDGGLAAFLFSLLTGEYRMAGEILMDRGRLWHAIGDWNGDLRDA